MIYLSSIKTENKNKAIALFKGHKQICSFPPRLNNFKILTVKEALMIWKGEAK